MIIDYCYSGHIELTAANIGAVSTAASYLQIVQLRQKCDDFSQMKLTNENCVEKMLRATQLNSQAELLHFMCQRFATIPIIQLVRMDFKSFQMLLNDEQLAAPESYVFEVMVKWVEHDGADRAKHVPALINCIRSHHMSTQVCIRCFSWNLHGIVEIVSFVSSVSVPEQHS